MQYLHPGARWIFRFRAYFTLLILGAFFGGFIVFPAIAIFFITDTIIGIVIVFIISLGFILIIGEIYARMAYNRWLYEIGEDSIRLERGIIWKKYSNIPYERVQNIDIHRGILARILGFSMLMIQTAGYSMPTRGHAEGSLPAIDPEYAERIREFILNRIKNKNSGI